MAGVNYTVTVNGNTTTITGPNTNYTIVINSYSASNYQGCGACGVGSTVSFTMVINATEGGLLDGFSEPTTTQNVFGGPDVEADELRRARSTESRRLPAAFFMLPRDWLQPGARYRPPLRR